MAILEFPLGPVAQQMRITLGDVEYTVRFFWCDSTEGGWTVDITSVEGVPLVQGLPLTAGEDVLQQLSYLGITGEIRVATDDDDTVEPTFSNLGSNGRVYFVQS